LHALLLLAGKYRVVVTDADSFSFGLYQVNDRYVVPNANSPDYISALLRIVRTEKVAAIFPGTEPEVWALCHQERVFVDEGCVVIMNSPEVVELCRDKWTLHRWLESNGFGVPRTVTALDWRNLVAQVGFPIVGKPTTGSGGSRNVALLKNEEEVSCYLEENRDKSDKIIFQEYLEAADNEYTVGVLVSQTGRIIDSILVHRKLVGLSLGARRIINNRDYALSTGYSQGFIVKHPVIQESCENLALKLGSRGPLNIQGRLVKGEFKVFEVHPRFSGTTSIRADAGFNEPDILFRNFLKNEQFGRIKYQSNVAAIRAFQNSLVPILDLDSIRRP
jgi:carbamoyl-phosphate synthase large subunit